MISRLLSLIKKEALAIKNDKKSLFVVIVPPLVQVIVFSFAATLEIKHLDIAVLDQDGSSESRSLVHDIEGSRYINKLYFLKGYQEIPQFIDKQKVLAVLVIPKDFSKNIHKGDAALQLLLDGRRSNTAQIAEGYFTSITHSFLASQLPKPIPINIQSRFLYNPNLSNFWWIVPSLFGSITMVVAILVTSLSIARERELGTFEQILVSPLRPFEILIGKLIPALLISTTEATLILLAAVYLFGVPLTGSLAILYSGVVIFLFSISGVGLFISAISKTQQQAILGSFVFMLPSFLLSGFATPVENMPSWLQPFTDFIPLKYYLILIKDVFLKDVLWQDTPQLLLPMFAIGVVTMATAMIFFRKRSR